MDKERAVEDLINDMSTSEIVEIYNNWCNANSYSDFIYDMDILDEVTSGYSHTKLLRMAEGNDFKTTDRYFMIPDTEAEIYSFDFYDDEDSPIDVEVIAGEVVRNNNDYGNKRIRELLEELEEMDDEDDE